jgi:hypothetical protein
MIRKVFGGGSVESEAIEAFAAKKKLELQEEVADNRNQVNRERIDVQRQSAQRRG